ncbi:MAG: DUF4157 domain-containing protein, partial [Gemmatimonadota bacterium]
MGPCKPSTGRAETLRRLFLPPERPIPHCLRPWLEQVFPGIDLAAVHFHDGLPDVVNLARLGGRPPAAITLPALGGVRDIRIYFRDGPPDPRTPAGLRLIAHEMVHVRQYRAWAGGRGLGFARAFMLPYLLGAARHGYRDHPLERGAWRFDGEVAECLSRVRLPCSGAADDPRPEPVGLEEWRARCGHVVFRGTATGLPDLLWQCTPGLERWWRWSGRVRRAGIWTAVPATLMTSAAMIYFGTAVAAVTLVTISIAIVWPVIKLFGTAAAGVAAAIGRVASALGRPFR